MVIKKSFKSLLKKSTAEEKNYLQSMFLFAQGEISTDEFIQKLKSTNGLADYLLSDKKIPNRDFEMKNFEHVRLDDFKSHESRYELYRIVYSFFVRRKIKGNYFNIEFELSKVIRENTPDYVFFSLDDILRDMPDDLTDNEQLQWCKQQCKKRCAHYKYDNKPPEWVHEPQWPKYHGRDMVFSYQEEEGDKVIYHFYDSATGQNKDIIQYY